MKQALLGYAAAAALAAGSVTPALAADDEAQLVRCETSYGAVAITDGSTQGWTEYKLSSPRPLIQQLIAQSGCFTLVNPATGEAADYLMAAEAGSKEEIDQAMNAAASAASSAATSALIRSGALSRVPGVGAVAGLLGGFGGKKKTISAALRLISPQNGLTVAAATGEQSKSVMKVMKGSEWKALGDETGGYTTSKDGRMVSSAFVTAYNSLVAQAAALPPVQTAAAPEAGAAQAAEEIYVVAIDSSLLAAASAAASPVRSLRAGTELVPTGNRQGLFVEVADNYGTTGWVSVEDLQ
ncbi:hypothetical protein B5C34_01965 [Pacificimonas flava]|uniref:SH3b domain-containing protein n=2 Tax=Pacificimonas TaxID=1960290 RepID=A0A219B3E0_9SPHN|nr:MULTISPECIES: hypothetical protein [Pacificimonas]MBZ6378016.1 SH3 domain-containing protein [Pacificimonas aurantium]OWV32339.1 hypothetical protein B5C34_01965 [Pacificimonas flava]